MKEEDNEPEYPKGSQAWLIAGAVFVFLTGPVSEMNHWFTWDAVHWALYLSFWTMALIVYWRHLQAIKRHLAGKSTGQAFCASVDGWPF